ncbi:unnamed protein product, partial [Staurois parvus]
GDRSRSERDGWDDRSRSKRDGWATVRSRRAWYRGSKRRMVGVTSQDQQVAGSVVPRVRQRDGQERAGVRAGEGQHKQNRQSLATGKRTYRTG